MKFAYLREHLEWLQVEKSNVLVCFVSFQLNPWPLTPDANIFLGFSGVVINF